MESCDYIVCGGDSIPFAQSSLLALGARSPLVSREQTRGVSGFAGQPTGLTLPSFAAAFWSRIRECPYFSDSFRKFPQPAGFFRFFPAFSACFRKFPCGFILDIRHFLLFCRFNHPLQPTGLQHNRYSLFLKPNQTVFILLPSYILYIPHTGNWHLYCA